MPSKKRATPISLQPLDALFGTSEETTNGISEIAIGSTDYGEQTKAAEVCEK